MAERKGKDDNPDLDIELAELLNEVLADSEPKQEQKRKVQPTAAIPRTQTSSKGVKMAERKGNDDNPDFDVELAELLNEVLAESEPKQEQKRKVQPAEAEAIPRTQKSSKGVKTAERKGNDEALEESEPKQKEKRKVRPAEENAAHTKQVTATSDATAQNKQQGNTPEDSEVESMLEETTSVATEEVTLQQAAREGMENEVHRKLQELPEETRKAVINEKDAQGYAALHHAAEKGHVKVMETLILNGADVEMKTEDKERCTALHLAAKHGQLAVLRLLLDPKKYIPRQSIADSCVAGQLKAAKPNSLDRYRETPLHIASRSSHAEVVTTLIKYKAGVSKANSDGDHPLNITSRCGHVEVARILLDHGAQINHADEVWSPLMQAVNRDHMEMVTLLLERGADIHLEDGDGETAFHWAGYTGNPKMVKVLLEREAEIDATNSDGDTCLAFACQSAKVNVELLTTLLEHGANVNTADKDGQTPLMQVCISNAPRPIVTTLLEHGAEIDKQNLKGATAIHIACRWGHQEIVEVLLKHGADITKMNSDGISPLMLAIQERHEDVVKVFIKSNKWDTAFKFCQNKNTPMREIIRRMPDLAVMVLDRCTRLDPDFAKDSEDFTVFFSYDLIDDFRDPGKSESSGDNHANDDDDDDDSTDFGDEASRSRVSKWIFPEDGGFSTEWGPEGFDRTNHPLNLMAQSENLKLLKHPLVTDMLRRKWKVTQVVYFCNLLFYSIFLAYLTGFALTAPNPLSETCQAVFKGNSSMGTTCEQSDSRRRSVFITAVFVIILALCRLVVEVLQMIQLKVNYFTDWVNWLEIFMVVFAIIFAWVFNTDCLCAQSWQWQIGTLAVFLAWVDFIIFVQKLPAVGIYVVMLTDILWIFIKTVPLTIMLVIAFGLGLFMTFFEPGVLRSPFSTPARSLLSIVTYSTGGFDFDAIFRLAPGGTAEDNDVGEIPFPPVSYILWIIFIIIMPILLNNLLIGLAVGDINKTLAKAEGKKVALEIELTLSVQDILPTALRRKFILDFDGVLPNRRLSLKEKVEKVLWGGSRFPSGREITESTNQVDHFKDLPHHTLSLTKDVHEMKSTHLPSLTKDMQDIKQKMDDLQKLLESLVKSSGQ